MSWLDTLEEIRSKDFSKATAAERERAARDVVNMCSYAAAVVAISPIPFSDALLTLPIQTGMVMTVGHIHGRRVDSASARELILELGATVGVGFLARQGIKAILPVFGALLTVPAAFAANWAIGRVAMEYFRDPKLSKEQLREVFRKAKREGGALFSRDAFERFRKRNEGDLRAVAEEEPSRGGADEAGEEVTPRPTRKAAAPKRPTKRPAGRKAKTAKPAARGQAARTPSRREATAKGRDEGAAQKAAAPTVRSLVEEELPRRLRARNEVTNRLQGVVHLDITGAGGGRWTLDFGKPGRWVSKGLRGEPRMTVRCEGKDFLAIATGRRSAETAVFSGALVLEPLDMELASQIGRILA